MPIISNRGKATPASPIRRLVPFAEAAKKRGVKIYHLNIGQPDILTPQAAVEAMKNADMRVIEYSHSAGTESYRQRLVEFYGRYGINGLQANDLIVTNGGSEALWFALMACLDAGDEIIVPEPFYANYNGFAKCLDVNIRPITASIETGFALPSIEEFRQLVNGRTRAILICNPGNPTGYLYSKEELEALRDIAIEHDLFLIVDEVYRDFCYDNAQHLSVLSIPGLENHAVVIDSISKRYSACGARIGVLISRNKELMQTALKFAQTRLSPSTIAQFLGEALVDTPAEYFASVKEEYNRRRELTVNRLRQMSGVTCPRPNGAFYIMVELPIDNTDRFCQWLLEEFQYQGETVMLAPGNGFYATPGLGEQQARIAYVLNEQDLDKAMTCLEEALKVYPGRK